MRTSRFLAASAVAALTVAVLAPSAGAADPHYEGGMSQQVGATTNTGDCTLSGDASIDQDEEWVGDTLSRTSTVEQVVTKNTDLTDTTTYTGTATSTLTLEEDGGQHLTGGTFTSEVSSALVPALGETSACVVTGSADAMGGGAFEITKDAWFHLEASKTAGGGLGVIIGAQGSGPTIAVFDLERGFKSTLTRTVFLPAGIYLVQAISRAPVSSDTNASSRLLQNAGSVTMEFALTDAGAATGPTTGSGRPFVALPSARACATHGVVVGWSKKAGKVSSATFYLGKKKITTVKNPKPGGKVVLDPMPDAKAATVKAALVVKTRQGTDKVVATRSYLACT